LKETNKDHILEIAVNEIVWVLQYSTADKDRVSNADTNVPILVTLDNGKELVIDGLHRLRKAVNKNLKTLPYRRVSKELFDKGRFSR